MVYLMVKILNLRIIKRILLLVVFSFCGLFLLTAQQEEKTVEFKIKEGIHSVNIDPLDNIYLFTDSFQLKKYNKDFELLYRYSDNKLTAETKIITDNSFKTILYNPDFGWIKVLDRRFGSVAEFQIFQLNVLNVSGVGAAADNQSIWLFDNMQQNLIKLDQQFKISLQRNNLHIELGQWINPTVIQEKGGWIYLYDAEKGVFVFDNLGAFYKRIPLKNATSFQVKKGDVFFQSDSIFHKYNMQTIDTEAMKTMNGNVQYLIGSNYLFVYNNDTRTLFKQQF